MTATLIKIDHEADVNRCLGLQNGSQCPFKAVPGHEYCERHAGVIVKQQIKEADNRNYRLTLWRARVNEFADHPKIKTLNEEIGITRLLLEETLNRCHDGMDLMVHSTKIMDIITRIQKLVAECHRLEEKSGLLIDKSTVLNLSGSIIQIIGDHVRDDNIIDAISSKILELITTSSILSPDSNNTIIDHNNS